MSTLYDLVSALYAQELHGYTSTIVLTDEPTLVDMTSIKFVVSLKDMPELVKEIKRFNDSSNGSSWEYNLRSVDFVVYKEEIALKALACLLDCELKSIKFHVSIKQSFEKGMVNG